MRPLIYAPIGMRRKTQQAFKARNHQSARIICTLGCSLVSYPETDERIKKITQYAHIHPWLRPFKTQLFKWQYNWTRRYFERQTHAIAVTWNGLKGSRGVFMQAAKDAHVDTLFYELGCFPGYLAEDPKGINYENSLVREKSFYVDWYQQHKRRADLAALKKNLTARQSIQHPNVAHNKSTCDLNNTHYIFCPLQVGSDTQMTAYSPWIDSLEGYIHLLAEVSHALPEGWHLRIKEHPSSPISHTDHIQSLVHEKLKLDNQTDTLEQMKHANAVMCINSSLGLQAFLFECPILILGQAFYAFADMTTNIFDKTSLIEALKNIERNHFDQELRNMFLHHLLCDYYIKV